MNFKERDYEDLDWNKLGQDCIPPLSSKLMVLVVVSGSSEEPVAIMWKFDDVCQASTALLSVSAINSL
jgi:hypothetical protein